MNMEEDADRGGGRDKVSGIINFLVANRMYPMFSTKGRLFLTKCIYQGYSTLWFTNPLSVSQGSEMG